MNLYGSEDCALLQDSIIGIGGKKLAAPVPTIRQERSVLI